MRVGLFVNNCSDLSVKTASEFEKLLQEAKIEYFFLPKTQLQADVIVVFGGDGTTVRAVDFALANDAPVLVVNTGTLGFLSDFQPNQLNQVIKALNEGANCSQRTLLEVYVGTQRAVALNDVVIKKCNDEVLKVIKFSAELDGEKIADFSADGLIVATPTGSTAYSLSAGGSIITPDTNAFIFTPICSHSLSSRSILYSDNKILKIKMPECCQVFVDGKKFIVAENQEIIVKKSERKLKTYFAKQDFFKRLNQKLNG